MPAAWLLPVVLLAADPAGAAPPADPTPIPKEEPPVAKPLTPRELQDKLLEVFKALETGLKAANLPPGDPRVTEHFARAADSIEGLHPELVEGDEGLNALQLVARIWLQIGNPARRSAVLDRAWGRADMPPEMRLQFGFDRATARLDQDQFGEADKAFDELWRRDDFPEGERGQKAIDWSNLLSGKKQHDAARKVLDEAWARKEMPVHARARVGVERAFLRLEGGDLPGAEKAADEIWASPEITPAARCRGGLMWAAALAHKGRKEEARKALARALEARPESIPGPEGVETLFGIPMVSEMAGAPELVLPNLRAALDDTKRPEEERLPLADALGEHLLRLGKFDDAGKLVDRVEKEFGPAGKPVLESLHAKQAFYALPGTPAPALVGADLRGKAVDLAEYKGKVVLLDYWATWCPPCRTEVPEFAQVWKELQPRGFEIIGVSLDRLEPEERRETLFQFLKDFRVGWRQMCDGKVWEGDNVKSYRVASIPAAILIDRTGTIRQVGVRSYALGAAAAALLEEKEPPKAPEKAPDAPKVPDAPPAPK